jgi:hypothetical protein
MHNHLGDHVILAAWSHLVVIIVSLQWLKLDSLGGTLEKDLVDNNNIVRVARHSDWKVNQGALF